MLSNSNDSRLRQKNVDNKYIFFFQRWQELLESRTLDMYQYNILNTYVACVELIDVIEKISIEWYEISLRIALGAALKQKHQSVLICNRQIRKSL